MASDTGGSVEADEQLVVRAVEWVKAGNEPEKLQAAIALRALASDPGNKIAIRSAGGVETLLQQLDEGPDSRLSVVAIETLSYLVADDQASRELVHRHGGIAKLVGLLRGGGSSEGTHRALLVLRILADKEQDRLAILQAGGVPLLVGLLYSGPESEVTEYAAAALGNLAAGGNALKNAIRDAGGIPPLVALIREDPDEISAELAAVVLRNLSLNNPANRQAIQNSGGLAPLLNLLSIGQARLHQPSHCVVQYRDSAAPPPGGEGSLIELRSSCCFDPQQGHLCIAKPAAAGRAAAGGGLFGCCFGAGATVEAANNLPPLRQGMHKEEGELVERYSMLRKLTITEPDSQTLSLSFLPADTQGVAPAAADNAALRILAVTISPCNATELKGAIMRMLTRMHLQREFRQHAQLHSVSRASLASGSGSLLPLGPFPSNAAIATGNGLTTTPLPPTLLTPTLHHHHPAAFPLVHPPPAFPAAASGPPTAYTTPPQAAAGKGGGGGGGGTGEKAGAEPAKMTGSSAGPSTSSSCSSFTPKLTASGSAASQPSSAATPRTARPASAPPPPKGSGGTRIPRLQMDGFASGNELEVAAHAAELSSLSSRDV